MKIIITTPHSGGFFTNGISQNVGGAEYLPLYKGILEGYNDEAGTNPGAVLYDLISPQMYTCNLGTTVEYAQNDAVAWVNNKNSFEPADETNSFRYSITQNPQYNKYGLNFITPAINYGNFDINGNSLYYDCYEHGGTNHNSLYPILYYYQANYNDQSGLIDTRTPFPSYFGIGHAPLEDFFKNGDKGSKDFFYQIMSYNDEYNTGS